MPPLAYLQSRNQYAPECGTVIYSLDSDIKSTEVWLNGAMDPMKSMVQHNSATLLPKKRKSPFWKRRRAGLGQNIERRTNRGITQVVLAIFVALAVIATAEAGELSQDRQTKAGFLINFAEFTEWPETAFANEKGPLNIGILGTDPFGKNFDKLVENEVLKGRRVCVLRYRKVQEIKTCHILYVSESEGSRLGRILRVLKEKPVLIVSEIENSVKRGVMIEMRTVDTKVRLAINLESAKAAHLTLSSKLLRLGEIVEPPKK